MQRYPYLFMLYFLFENVGRRLILFTYIIAFTLLNCKDLFKIIFITYLTILFYKEFILNLNQFARLQIVTRWAPPVYETITILKFK